MVLLRSFFTAMAERAAELPQEQEAHESRGERKSPRTPTATLALSQRGSGPPVSPKSPPSPSLRSQPSRPPSLLQEAALLIDASAKERPMLQSLNLLLCFQWCCVFRRKAFKGAFVHLQLPFPGWEQINTKTDSDKSLSKSLNVNQQNFL